ncbi:MAG TPA: hypothetical protein VLI41_09420 [Phenylobacterium sp.]|uniref:hypothetical protein n=1 Tax=Phenylobacterium sp. TaxID=1871053 RepID=UPI002B8E9802|nr:hypothetical protein [Phenylobacterium sp.]HSV03412.1 hypothetical protein [Phenylobacterium sp.]
MSAKIERFPAVRRPAGGATLSRGETAALRYASRAEEALQLLAMATTDLERAALCGIVEAWLDLAEAALPDQG